MGTVIPSRRNHGFGSPPKTPAPHCQIGGSSDRHLSADIERKGLLALESRVRLTANPNRPRAGCTIGGANISRIRKGVRRLNRRETAADRKLPDPLKAILRRGPRNRKRFPQKADRVSKTNEISIMNILNSPLGHDGRIDLDAKGIGHMGRRPVAIEDRPSKSHGRAEISCPPLGSSR